MQLLTAFFTAGTVMLAEAAVVTSADWLSTTRVCISSAAVCPMPALSPPASMAQSVMASSLNVISTVM